MLLGLGFLAMFLIFLFLSGGYAGNVDQQLLLDFKSSLKDPKGYLSDWNSSKSEPCLWTGVTCDDARSEIVELNLSSMGLLGNLSPNLTSFLSLTHLSLQGNNLSGDIPADLFIQLKTLTYVNLSFNNLSGIIPPHFSASASLQVLDAQHNNLVGGIPPQLASQVKLVHLNLRENPLGGPIPEHLCNLVNLQQLFLACSGHHGAIPDCLMNLTRLQWLDIGQNDLTASIPPSISNLKNLEHLDMARNKLSGSIPAEIGRLSLLKKLYLWQNNLSGTIPPSLGNLSQLLELDLSNNTLEGEIPLELSRLDKLQVFLVLKNSLTGTFPTWLANHPHVSSISLSMNRFHGIIPQNLGANSPLAGMDLSENNFTGNIPPNLCKNKFLSYLVLMSNHLSGPLPDDLQSCKTLSRLRLEDNQLSGSIRLSTPALDFATMHNNFFNGTFTIDSDTSMHKLRELNLSGNRLTGTLPAQLGSLTDLQRLGLAKNLFSGHVPPQLGNLQQLAELDLSSNLLSGDIPASLSKLSMLIQLNLSRNHFNGSISNSLGGMQKLSIVDLSHNNFSGEFPTQLGQSPLLAILDLSYNNLTGEVSDSYYTKGVSIVGNAHLRWSNSSSSSSSSSEPAGTAYTSRKKMLLITITLALSIALMLSMYICVRSFKLHGTRDIVEPTQPWTLTCYQKHLKIFLEDVLECANNKDNLIGKRVYKGKLSHSGVHIAVKRLESTTRSVDNEGAREFQAEVATLANVRHRNVLKLLASCSNGTTHLLVYEYMHKGNLRDVLEHSYVNLKRDGGVLLDWDTRLNIIRGTAEALSYLHCGYGLPRIVHRDVKCDNILLDEQLEPRLGDFGQSMMLLDDKQRTASKFVGTHGYIAPEYAYTMKVDEKVDVYSFGIVMLELLTGKWATWRTEQGDMGLVDWVSVQDPTHLMMFNNMSLQSDASTESSYRTALQIALSCVVKEPKRRPTMEIVLVKLTSMKKSEDKKTAETATQAN